MHIALTNTSDEILRVIAIKTEHTVRKPIAVFAVITLKTFFAVNTFIAKF